MATVAARRGTSRQLRTSMADNRSTPSRPVKAAGKGGKKSRGGGKKRIAGIAGMMLAGIIVLALIVSFIL